MSEDDLSPLEYLLSRNPIGVISFIRERIKLGAKILGRTSGIKHSTALGYISVAVGFTGWHSFNAHLINVSTSSPYTVSPESIARLTQSLVFLIKSGPDRSLSEPCIVAFQEFGARLSIATGLPAEVIMDTVCAGYCGGASWSEVTSRSPLKSTVPLYEFETLDEASKTGRFIWTDACGQLIRSLDDVYQGAYTPERVAEAKRWMEQTLRHQPGFLEAGLCLAQIHYDEGNLKEAFVIVNTHIRQAERLIPKGFRGKIEWGFLTNRFYHRLLWLRMTIYHDAEWMRYCLRDARKQLRLNPHDNLGVRDIYPLMLLEVGEFEKAAKASKFPKEDGYHVALIRAFGRFAIGDYPGFLQNLTKALFDLPVLRLFLLDSPGTLPDGDDGFRTVIPDMKTFERYAWPAYEVVPGLVEACNQFLANQFVQDAEAQLRALWMGDDEPDNRKQWFELKSEFKSTIPLLLADKLTYASP
jgi:hypothetical protein